MSSEAQRWPRALENGAAVVATWEVGGIVKYTVLAEQIHRPEVSSTGNAARVSSSSTTADQQLATEEWLRPAKRLRLTPAPGVAPADPTPGTGPNPGVQRPTLGSPPTVFAEFNRLSDNGDLSFCWTCSKDGGIKARCKMYICPQCWSNMDQGERDRWHARANPA